MKMLVTGFEPFGEHAVNPTEELVRSIKTEANEPLKEMEIVTAVLPVVFDECVEKLIEIIEETKPDAVLCCGLAAGRSAVTVERIGINIKDVGDGQARKDNSGQAPTAEKIVPGGPDGLFATIPVESIVRRMQQEGIPASVSNTAGTYICNNTLYGLLHAAKERNWPIRGGFIHFPATPVMAAQKPALPSMSIDTMKRALTTAILATAEALQRT
ncbi:pyroglutamyl-peptidase I [Paenibacillus thermotolerans]|uniref:pyroglutamyl-peptidase I n=1 Tax=Paenibacillus thermotolerans TaxID=3027807 RepID=UPI002367C3C0|nr:MULTISPECIES: pyroglutamyl-peptidase I [unclassified Paenibacillus]